MNNFQEFSGRQTRRPVVDGIVHDRARQPISRHVYLSRNSDDPNARNSSVKQISAPVVEPTIPAPTPVANVAQTPVRNAAQTPALTTSPAIPVSPKKYSGLNMSLPGAEELIKKQPSIRRRRLDSLRTWAFRGSVTALVLVMGVGGLLVAQGFMKANNVFKGGATAAALQKDVAPHQLKGEGDGRINILLLGAGGAGHEAPDLTDTIMLASIDPVNKTASLVSIPRDMWVQGPGGTPMKVNAAFATAKYNKLGKIDTESKDEAAIKAGVEAIDEQVEHILGVNVHYNMLVDFKAFRQAIDTVGGVNINVPEQLYDPTMAWENGRNPILAKAGQQTFDGKKALMYVRSRHTSSDFARSERQRAVLLALKDKVVTLGTLSNPLKISELISAFGNNVYSDLSLADSVSLAKIFKDIKNTNVKSIGLADEGNSFVTTGAVGDQSVVLPKAGMFDFSEIRNYIRGVLADGYIKKENSNIVLLNGTEHEGLATLKGDTLKSYGYNVTKLDNAPTSNYDQTVIVDLTNGADKYTKNYLEKRFAVKSTTKLPDSAIIPGEADFIIILGNNEAFSSED